MQQIKYLILLLAAAALIGTTAFADVLTPFVPVGQQTPQQQTTEPAQSQPTAPAQQTETHSSSSGGGTSGPIDMPFIPEAGVEPAPAATFADVKSTDYFADAVAWALEKGITNGVDASHFAPTSPCNRGQMVTFLWRAAGCPEPKGGTTKFTDVKADDYYAKAVAWAVENNITLGMTETAFEPSSPVTRAQAVTFLWRAQGKPAASAGETFADVEGGSYYAEAVRWATANNVTNGTGSGFEPYTTVNRAMSVTFLYRAFR